MNRALAIAVPSDAPKLEPAYFVLQRNDGEWSPATKVIQVFVQLQLAEFRAADLKKQFPHQTFAVAALFSEARHVPNPIEIVRLMEHPK